MSLLVILHFLWLDFGRILIFERTTTPEEQLLFLLGKIFKEEEAGENNFSSSSAFHICGGFLAQIVGILLGRALLCGLLSSRMNASIRLKT